MIVRTAYLKANMILPALTEAAEPKRGTKYMKTKVLFATLLTLALFTAGYAQKLDKAKLDRFFDRLAEKNKAMGSLTIAKDGKVLYTRAIGYSQINGTEKKPLTAANRFRIGSITKMYTAVLILQLVEGGQLELADTLDEFFPQVANAERITISQILAHRSGIHDSLIDRNLRPSSRSGVITKDELLNIIAAGTPDAVTSDPAVLECYLGEEAV